MALGYHHAHGLWPGSWASMWSLVTTWATDINIEPGSGRATDPDMVLCSSLGLDITLNPGGCAGHLDCHGPQGNMALGHQCGPRWQPRPPALVWYLMVSGVIDIHTDFDWGRAMDPGMTVGHSPDLDNTMASADSTGHSNRPGLSSGTSFRHQHGHRLQPRPQAFCDPWRQHGLRTSARTLAIAGPWT